MEKKRIHLAEPQVRFLHPGTSYFIRTLETASTAGGGVNLPEKNMVVLGLIVNSLFLIGDTSSNDCFWSLSCQFSGVYYEF